MAPIKFVTKVMIILFLHLLFSLPAAEAEDKAPHLISGAAVLMDARTGQVLYEKNMHKKQYPASVTKIMTGLLALERGEPDDILTMSREAVFTIGRDSAHIALDTYEEISLVQALYAISLASANDAANGIAEYMSGSQTAFAALMTERARSLGAQNTNFRNAHGLPDSSHYSTAYDMALIMREAIKTPGFMEIFSRHRYEIPPTNMQPETRYLNNTNSFFNGTEQYEGIMAGKSGWTEQANHTLVSAAKRGGRELIVVVLNSQNTERYSDTIKLFDYGFNAFRDVTFETGDLLSRVAELGADYPDGIAEISVDGSPGKNVVRLLHNSFSRGDVEKSYEVIESADVEDVRLQMEISLKNASPLMHKSLGSFLLTIRPVQAERHGYTFFAPGLNILYYILAAFCFLILRRRIRLIRRRRRRRFVRLNTNKYRKWQ